MVWDEPKRLKNLLPPPAGHGLDFADARDRFEWDTALVLSTYPSRHGVGRRVAIGFLDDGVVTLVFAPLGTQAVSAISLRRASAFFFQQQISNDPDNPKLTGEELVAMKRASEVLPAELYCNLNRRRYRTEGQSHKGIFKS